MMEALFAWLRKWRMQRLEVRLAGVEAEIAADAEIARCTGWMYPTSKAVRAKTRAEILKKMEHIRSASVSPRIPTAG